MLPLSHSLAALASLVPPASTSASAAWFLPGRGLAAGGERLFWALGLLAARTVPLAWLVPAFGGPRVAGPFRIGIGGLLAVLCLPVAQASTAGGWGGAGGLGPAAWAVLLAREVLVGATVGFCVGLTFAAAEAAGRLVDLARGAPLDAAVSPVSDERTSPTGELYLFLALLVFFELGGLGALANALARSYEAIPLFVPGPSVNGVRSAAELVTAGVGKLLESAVGLAAPVLVALWLADAVLGLIARAVPGLPIAFVAMPARALLGLGMVLAGLGLVDAALGAGLPGWFALWERAFAVWRRP